MYILAEGQVAKHLGEFGQSANLKIHHDGAASDIEGVRTSPAH